MRQGRQGRQGGHGRKFSYTITEISSYTKILLLPEKLIDKALSDCYP